MCNSMHKPLALWGEVVYVNKRATSMCRKSLSHNRSSDSQCWNYDTHNELQFSQKYIYKILLTQENNSVHI